MVIAVQFGRRPFAQGTARRDPIQDLDALRARLAHHFMHRIAGQRIGIDRQIIHAERVVCRIDKPGAFAIQLVRQAACAHHHNALIARPAPQCLVDRTAQGKTALGRRQRVLHRIDRNRHTTQYQLVLQLL